MPIIRSNTVQVHVAAYVPELRKYKFLVLQRSSKSKLYPKMWQTITGKLKSKETAKNAAIREFVEETGLKATSAWAIPYVSTFYDYRRDIIQMSPVFGVEVDFRSKIKLSDEHQAYEWLSFENCMKKFPLASHQEGLQRFWDVILSKEDRSLFKII